MRHYNLISHDDYTYYNRLYESYLTLGTDLSTDDFIELGKHFREINENRFQVWVYKLDDEKKYRYQIMESYRKFLDDFNEKVGNEGLTFNQVHHFITRYKNRGLIIKNLYEKANRKQQYSTISERMWNTVLGVGKNTQFINLLIDCGVIVRVYNASGTRGISSIYSLNYKLLKQLYEAFSRIPDYWEKCQIECELDKETFEELSNGEYSQTVTLFQDNVEDTEDIHTTFVEFCSNKNIEPEKNIINDLNEIFKKNIFRTGVDYKINNLNDVARVYGYLYDLAEEKGNLKNWRKVSNRIYTNAQNYIKYTPSIRIENKIVKGIGIRAVTELCTKPKFETLKEKIQESTDSKLYTQYVNEAYLKSREYILSKYGELDHFDASSSIPHIMFLMNRGKYESDKDLYYYLAEKPDDWNDFVRKIYKQAYMQAHFSDSSFLKVYNNIMYDFRQKGKDKEIEWMKEHKSEMYVFIANVQNETPDGLSTMDFYHESNIFILLREYWTRQGIETVAQVYDSFWFKKGDMTREQFKKDLKMISELYYKSYKGNISPDKMLDFYNK